MMRFILKYQIPVKDLLIGNRKMRYKSRLINWKEVDYSVDSYNIERLRNHSDFLLPPDFKQKHPDKWLIYHKDIPIVMRQPTTWRLFLMLIYMLLIHTLFAVSVSMFVEQKDPLQVLILVVTILLTGFLFSTFLENFTIWVKFPVIIYLFLLLIYIIYSIG